MSQHPIGVTYVASLLDQELDGLGCERSMVNICVEKEIKQVYSDDL